MSALSWLLHVQPELCSCCPQLWGLAISLWRKICSLGNRLDCLGVPLEPFGPTTRLDATQSRYWNLNLGEEMSSCGYVSSIICQFYLDHVYICILYMYIYFRKLLLHYISILPFNWPLILSINACILSLVPLLSPHLHLILPLQSSCPHPHNYYIPFYIKVYLTLTPTAVPYSVCI